MAEPVPVRWCAVLPPAAGPALIDLDRLRTGSLDDLDALERHPHLTIGVVQRRCDGFALATAMAVDLLVAAPGATFGHPGPWTAVVLRRGDGICGAKVASYLAMTDRRIGASQAQRWGLVSHLAADPAAAAAALGEAVAARSAAAVATIRREAHRGSASDHALIRATGGPR